MNLKIGDEFIATDRVGRKSTWRFIDKKDENHFLLEATGETLAKYEKNNQVFKNLEGKSRIRMEDHCRIEVCSAWFQYRKIRIVVAD